MLESNWDRQGKWEPAKLQLWLGMLLEVSASGTPVYEANESLWAVRYLIRHHQYPSIQFSDFDLAVKRYRYLKREYDKKQRERQLDLEAGDLETRRERYRRLAPLLRLAAPRKMP